MKFKSAIAIFIALIPGLLAALSKDDCNEEVLFHFFPRPFVLEVMEKHGVPKNQAEEIAKKLSDSDPAVVQKIEQKAKEMDPNPLTDENAHQQRAKLFREVITDVFNNVVSQYGVTDIQDTSVMLDEIQKMRMERFEQCRKEGLIPEMPGR